MTLSPEAATSVQFTAFADQVGAALASGDRDTVDKLVTDMRSRGQLAAASTFLTALGRLDDLTRAVYEFSPELLAEALAAFSPQVREQLADAIRRIVLEVQPSDPALPEV